MRLEQLKSDYNTIVNTCFVEASLDNTLRNFVKQSCEKSFFDGIAKRFYIAREFVRCCNDLYNESRRRKRNAINQIAFFNVDNLSVSIQEITEDNKKNVSVGYNVDLVLSRIHESINHKRSMFGSVKKFFNYQYADQRLVYKCKGADGNKEYSWRSNEEIFDAFDESQICRTISIIIFFALFGTHPLFGRAYYEQSNLKDEYENTLFFIKSHKFIFEEIESNPNRFINGFHEEAWTLWQNLSKKQTSFFENAFANKFVSFEHFVQEWQNAFEFSFIKAKAKCGEEISTLLFYCGHTILLTQRSCGQNVRCRNFKKGIEGVCEKCRVPNEERSASLLWVQAYLHDTSKPDVVSKSLILHEGGVLRNSDIHDLSSDTVLFECGADTKKEKLAIKCKMPGVEIVTDSGNKPFKIDGYERLVSKLKIQIDQYRTLEIC